MKTKTIDGVNLNCEICTPEKNVKTQATRSAAKNRSKSRSETGTGSMSQSDSKAGGGGVISSPKATPLKVQQTDLARRGIRFDYLNHAASHVSVAGSFNDWHPSAAVMRRFGDGMWSVELDIPPGRHEYRFVVDGQWHADPMATEFVPNPYGGLNSVLEVSPYDHPSECLP